MGEDKSIKPWSELTDAERVEVLRNEIFGLRNALQSVHRLEKSFRDISVHQHNKNGDVVYPSSCVQTPFNSGLSGCTTNRPMTDRLM